MKNLRSRKLHVVAGVEARVFLLSPVDVDMLGGRVDEAAGIYHLAPLGAFK